MANIFNKLRGTTSQQFQIGKNKVDIDVSQNNLITFEIKDNNLNIINKFTLDGNGKILFPNGNLIDFVNPEDKNQIKMVNENSEIIFDLKKKKISIDGEELKFNLNIDEIKDLVKDKVDAVKNPRVLYGTDNEGNFKAYDIDGSELGNINIIPTSEDEGKTVKYINRDFKLAFDDFPKEIVYFNKEAEYNGNGSITSPFSDETGLVNYIKSTNKTAFLINFHNVLDLDALKPLFEINDLILKIKGNGLNGLLKLTLVEGKNIKKLVIEDTKLFSQAPIIFKDISVEIKNSHFIKDVVFQSTKAIDQYCSVKLSNIIPLASILFRLHNTETAIVENSEINGAITIEDGKHFIFNNNKFTKSLTINKSNVQMNNCGFIKKGENNVVVNGGNFKAFSSIFEGSLSIAANVNYSLTNCYYDHQNSYLMGNKVKLSTNNDFIKEYDYLEMGVIKQVQGLDNAPTQHEVNKIFNDKLEELFSQEEHNRGFVLNPFKAEKLKYLKDSIITNKGQDYKVGDTFSIIIPDINDITPALLEVQEIEANGSIQKITIIGEGLFPTTEITKAIVNPITVNGTGFTTNLIFENKEESTLNNIQNPKLGDFALVLRDNITPDISSAIYRYSKDGKGTLKWIREIKDQSTVKVLVDNITIGVKNNKLYVKKEYAEKDDVVDIDSNQDVNGVKNFVHGIKVPEKNQILEDTAKAFEPATEKQVVNVIKLNNINTTKEIKNEIKKHDNELKEYIETVKEGLQKKAPDGKKYLIIEEATNKLNKQILSEDVKHNEQTLDAVINELPKGFILNEVRVDRLNEAIAINTENRKIIKKYNEYNGNKQLLCKFKIRKELLTNDDTIQGLVDFDVNFSDKVKTNKQEGLELKSFERLVSITDELVFVITQDVNNNELYNLIVKKLSIKGETEIETLTLNKCNNLEDMGIKINNLIRNYPNTKEFVIKSTEKNIPYTEIFGSKPANSELDRDVLIKLEIIDGDNRKGQGKIYLLPKNHVNFAPIYQANITFDRAVNDLNIKTYSFNVTENEKTTTIKFNNTVNWNDSYGTQLGNNHGLSFSKIKSGSKVKPVLQRNAEEIIEFKTINGQPLLVDDKKDVFIDSGTNTIITLNLTTKLTLKDLYNQLLSNANSRLLFEITKDKAPDEIVPIIKENVTTIFSEKYKVDEEVKFRLRIYENGFQAHQPIGADGKKHPFIYEGLLERYAVAAGEYLYTLLGRDVFLNIVENENSLFLSNSYNNEDNSHLRIKKIKSGAEIKKIAEINKGSSNDEALELVTINGESLLGNKDIKTGNYVNLTNKLSWDNNNIVNFNAQLLPLIQHIDKFVLVNEEQRFPELYRTQIKISENVTKIFTKLSENLFHVITIGEKTTNEVIMKLHLQENQNFIRALNAINIKKELIPGTPFQTVVFGEQDINKGENVFYVSKIKSGNNIVQVLQKDAVSAAANTINIKTINGESLLGKQNLEIQSNINGKTIVDKITEMQDKHNQGESEAFSISQFIEIDL